MMLTSPMDALSYSLCFDTTSLAHRDAVRGERHPPHLWKTCLLTGRRPPGRSGIPAGLPVEPKAMEPRRGPAQRYPCGRVADKGGDRSRATRDQVPEAADSAFGRGMRPEQ